MAIEQDKIALISGATGGIGQAIAIKLDALGFRLLLIDREEEALRAMHEQFTNSSFEVCDLTNPEALESLCKKIETIKSQLEVAIINAGIVITGNVLTLSRSQLDQHIDVNLRSAMHLNHACAAKMKTQKQGHIINTVSMGAFVALEGSAAYCASKFGLRGFLLSLRAEMAPYGVDVSAVHPGGVDSPMLHYEALNDGSPFNFIHEPNSVDDVAVAMLKALKSKRMEYYVPYSDSFGARLLCAFPWLLGKLFPVLSWWGERGRKKFIHSRGLVVTNKKR